MEKPPHEGDLVARYRKEALGDEIVKIEITEALKTLRDTENYQSVQTIASERIPDFDKLTETNQQKVCLYLLLGELLRLEVWERIANETSIIVAEKTYLDGLNADHPYVDILKNGSWEETCDVLTELIGSKVRDALLGWGFTRKAQSDPHAAESTIQNRYDEAEQIMQDRKISALRPTRSVSGMFNIGYTTGIEYYFGLLKYAPEFLANAGIEPTLEKIADFAKNNFNVILGRYATLDKVSFTAIDAIITPHTSPMTGPMKPNVISPEYFILGPGGKLQMRDESVSQAILMAHAQHDFNAVVSHVFGDSKTNQTAHIRCPILFSGQTGNLDLFFGELRKAVYDTQKQYT